MSKEKYFATAEKYTGGTVAVLSILFVNVPAAALGLILFWDGARRQQKKPVHA